MNASWPSHLLDLSCGVAYDAVGGDEHVGVPSGVGTKSNGGRVKCRHLEARAQVVIFFQTEGPQKPGSYISQTGCIQHRSYLPCFR